MAVWTIPVDSNEEMDGALVVTVSNPTISSDTDGGNFTGPSGLWFELIHVAPLLIEPGNIVTQIQVPLNVFNAFREDDKSWDSVVIDADGVSLNNPTLPVTLQELNGYDLLLTIDPEGAVNVDGTITFTFDGGSVVLVVTIQFQRLSAFPFIPETGVTEELQWRTVIGPANDGTEQRMATLIHPRQFIIMDVEVEEGPEKQRVDNFLHANTGKLVGVPVWWDQNRLSQSVAITDTTINLYSAEYADYRVEGTAILWASETDFEIVNVDSITATTLEISSGATKTFAADQTIVAPLRVAWLMGSVKTTRQTEGLTNYRIVFHVNDNEVELSDTSAFNTYNSKVLFDGFNKIETAAESWDRVVEVVDGETGVVNYQQLEPNARRRSQKGFITESPQELWELRGVLHALRGMQVSFYLPTKTEEFTPTAALAIATASMDFVNVGYNENVDATPGRNHLRVNETDGTTHDREIISSSVIDTDEESLVVDSNWPSTIAVADIDYVEILEKVRWDTDRFRIVHEEIAGDARMVAATRSVLE